MTIHNSHSLKPYNTLGIDVSAEHFVVITSSKDLSELIRQPDFIEAEKFLLGGGSNVLFTHDMPGYVLYNRLHGISVIEDTDEYVVAQVGTGENWHEFVTYCVNHQYAGIENLALIPGTVGGAVVQNIGAYGQNLMDHIINVEAYELSTGQAHVFSVAECNFGYRTSIFKQQIGKYFVTSATFKLNKQFNLESSYHGRRAYESLAGELATMHEPPYQLQDAFEAVIRLRTKKLPDPGNVGTCGSFFRNPVVSAETYKKLAKIIPELQSYPVDKLLYTQTDWSDIDAPVKIPAGRLLDELGWRGKWIGNVGTHDKHALCVITNKNATGPEVQSYIKAMQESVHNAYGVKLKPEVIIV